jgi:phage terminase small subunit
VKSWQPHPAHYIGNNHLENFMKWVTQFGFTPAARMKLAIQTPQPKEQTQVARLLKKTA